MFTHLNPLAIIIVAILNILLGMAWYSASLFGNKWADALQLRYEEFKPTASHYFGGFIVSLITAIVMAIFVDWLDLYTLLEGAIFGFLIWLGFVATSHFSGVIWAKKPLKAYIIDASFLLISYIMMGAILAAW